MEEWEEGDDDAMEDALEVVCHHGEGWGSTTSWRQVWGSFRKFSPFFGWPGEFCEVFGSFLWVWCQQRETALYESGVGRANLDLMREQELICLVFGLMLNTMCQIFMEPSKSYITQPLLKFSPTIPD